MLGALLGASGVSSAFAEVSLHSYDPSAPKTRAEVVNDLRDWLAAGYDPSDWDHYPENAQQASRIVAERRAQQPGAAPVIRQ